MSNVVGPQCLSLLLLIMAQQKMAVLQGDARRPESVQTFVRESVEDSYGAADLYSTLSLILGLISFTLKVTT